MENNEKREWRPKNWHLFVTLMAIGLVVGVIAYFVAESTALKRSGIYRDAVAVATEDGRVVGAIGSPVSEGTFVTGHLKEEKDSGNASIVIPLSGPEGDAALFVVAHKRGGTWEYKSLRAKVSKTGGEIDLLTGK